MDKRIIKFILKHHVLTIATTYKGCPWVANCFYAYSEEKNFFIFTSDRDTRHIRDLDETDRVAASIVLETKIIGKIQGIQLRGKLGEVNEKTVNEARKVFIKKFPFVALMDTTLWILEPDYIKFTDNRLGFGKKLIWEITKKQENESRDQNGDKDSTAGSIEI